MARPKRDVAIVFRIEEIAHVLAQIGGKNVKVATIIKKCSEKGEEVFYCAHNGQEAVLYRKCVLYLLPKGSAKKIRDATEGKIVRKAAKAIKNELSAIDRNQLSEDYMALAKPTKRTAHIGKMDKKREIVELKTENTSKWVDKDYMNSFGRKCEFYFAEDGWHGDQIYVAEKGKVVGMIMRVKF